MNIKSRICLLCILVLSITSFNTRANTTYSKKISVLIIDGYSNHDWKQTTQIVTQILEKTTLFSVDVSTAPNTKEASGWDTWQPHFKNYDVIIQNTNSYGGRPTWPKHVKLALEAYVKSGGGLYILHSANNAFPEWEAYNDMIGLGWRNKNFGSSFIIDDAKNLIRIPKGEGYNTSHGKRIDALIKRFTKHPINKGYPKEWKASDLEIYSYPRGSAKNLTVLSYSKEPKTKLNFPTEWVVNYGKGRVYNSTFGHVWTNSEYPNSMRCVAFQTTLIRAMQWLATKQVTWKIPSNFPDKDTISLEQI